MNSHTLRFMRSLANCKHFSFMLGQRAFPFDDTIGIERHHQLDIIELNLQIKSIDLNCNNSIVTMLSSGCLQSIYSRSALLIVMLI